MRDFTLSELHELLVSFNEAYYVFVSFLDYLERPDSYPSVVILRHDVDRCPQRSLKIAEMEKGIGIRGTYYFRYKERMFPEEEIRGIADSGHEIGYHYEDFHRCRGGLNAAIMSFQVNLGRLRQIAPVKTICMHGSPTSKYDNRNLWKERSYKEFGIIGEPYFDIDFDKVMYLTDTGRRWDGESVSIRDKVKSERFGVKGEKKEDRGLKSVNRNNSKNNQVTKRLKLHSTKDIINALRNNELPNQIMLTIHPQRWSDNWGPWTWELISQKVKNAVKYFVARKMGSENSLQF